MNVSLLPRRIRVVAAAAATAFALVVAGCSNAGQSASPGADGQLTEVRVGSIPIIDTAAFQLGVSKGFFEEEGLKVTLTDSQAGSTILSSVVSGDTDIGFSNLVSVIIAEDKGMPIQYFAPTLAATGDREHDHGAILVLNDSPIQTPKDLEGKTVGVNALENVGEIVTNNAVEVDGGDWTKVQYVEMNFSDMLAAMENNQIDAAWMVDPFVSIVEKEGGRNISPVFVEFDPQLQVAGFFTSDQYAAKNPETLTAFTEALKKSNTYATDNPEETRAFLSTYTQIDPEIQELVSLPRWPTEVYYPGLQKFADSAYKYGMVSKQLKAEDLYQAPPAP